MRGGRHAASYGEKRSRGTRTPERVRAKPQRRRQMQKAQGGFGRRRGAVPLGGGVGRAKRRTRRSAKCRIECDRDSRSPPQAFRHPHVPTPYAARCPFDGRRPEARLGDSPVLCRNRAECAAKANKPAGLRLRMCKMTIFVTMNDSQRRRNVGAGDACTLVQSMNRLYWTLSFCFNTWVG
jgi:hypothetical protein